VFKAQITTTRAVTPTDLSAPGTSDVLTVPALSEREARCRRHQQRKRAVFRCHYRR
jgi:hypothetical protein